MIERTNDDGPGPENVGLEKVRTFGLIDEVPGASYSGPDSGTAENSKEAAFAIGAREKRVPRTARLGAGFVAVRIFTFWRKTWRYGRSAVRRRLPTTRRGKVSAVVVVASMVVLVIVAGVLVNAEQRERALIAAPGGVRDVGAEPTEQWSISMDNPTAASLIEMPGVLAIVGDEKVRGVDPESGSVLWSVDIGQHALCGPSASSGMGGPQSIIQAQPLVCVHPSGQSNAGEREAGQSRQTVTVIDRDGSVTLRELDSNTEVVPAAGGSLISLELTGGRREQGQVVLDKRDVPHLPEGFVGPDLVVRLEDAATGKERWSETVAFAAPRSESCLTYRDNTPVLDVAGSLRWDVRGGMLDVLGCGISAVFHIDGSRIDNPMDSMDLLDPQSSVSLPHGGWIGPGTERTDTGALKDVVHLPAGGTVMLNGQALVPWATDGRDPQILLEHVGSGTNALSTDDEDAGVRLWSAPQLDASVLLALASGTAVIVDGEGAVRGIDLSTGADRWTLDSEILTFHMPRPVSSLVFGAFTDGDNLLLAVTEDPSQEVSGLRLLTIDLHDGSVRWDIAQETPYTQLISVDGYLAQITQQGVVGLG